MLNDEDWGQISAEVDNGRSADAAAVSSRGAKSLVDADLAALNPKLQLAGDIDADSARSVKTVTEEDDEGAASCGADSRHSVPATANAALFVSRCFGLIRFSTLSLPRLGDASADTTPAGTVEKVEPAHVGAPASPPAELWSKQSTVQIVTPLSRLRLCRAASCVRRMMLGKILPKFGLKALPLILCGETSSPRWELGAENAPTIFLR